MGIVSDLSIIIVSALLGSILAVSLRLPPLLGYIAAGILIGPHVGLVKFTAVHDIEALSELGVALLLFALGLEFSLSQLQIVRRIAIFGTTIQLFLTAAIGFLIAKVIGLGTLESIAFGALITVSSTVVVLKNLANLGVLSTLSGRVMIGILLVQDLAVIPLMLLLPRLALGFEALHELPFIIAKGLLIIVIAVTIDSKLLPLFMSRIARENSRELFIISIAAVAIGVSYAGYLLGFSYAFGAFVAGMALSDSGHQHRALADIIPLRDLFILLFFVTVGMMVDPSYVLNNFWTIIFVVTMVMLTKAVVFYGLAIVFKYRNVVPVAVALGLCQVGEFSFALAQVSVRAGTISNEVYNLVVAVTVVSLLLAPFLAGLVGPIYARLKSWRPELTLVDADFKHPLNEDFVVIIGGGRVGLLAAKTLKAENKIPLVIEDNFERALLLKDKGFNVMFGDASNHTVMEAARFENAKIILIAIADKKAVEVILDHLKRSAPNVPVIARAHSREEMRWLRGLGVKKVVEPFFEAGIEMSMQALAVLQTDKAYIEELTERLREEGAFSS